MRPGLLHYAPHDFAALARAGGARVRPSRGEGVPWPRRPPRELVQSQYWQGVVPIVAYVANAGVRNHQQGVPTAIEARSTLFCSRFDAGTVANLGVATGDARDGGGGAWPMVMRGNERILVVAGVIRPVAFPATALRLEILTGTSSIDLHAGQAPVTLTAAQAAIAGFGVAIDLTSAPPWWAARLVFVDLGVPPAFNVGFWIGSGA